MAGIGFRLQKLLSGKSYTDLIKAYLFSAVIMTGPILVVLVSLALVKAASQWRLSIEEGYVLLSLIVYVYAFSMVGVSPFLYIVTRYLADKQYMGEIDTHTPAYLAVLLIVFLFQSVVALLFLSHLPLELAVKWPVFCLYLLVNGIWLAMVFLSAARSYLWIVWAYFLGGALGTAAAMFLGRQSGLSGFLNGYALGQAILFFILTVRIFIEFGCRSPLDFGFLAYAKKYPYLVLVGIFYYIGIWVDKFVFWFSPGAQVVAGQIHVFPRYDTPMFLAFLTVIPSMAYFLIQMETSFFRHYQGYYKSIREREGLQSIREKKQGILRNLTGNFQRYALFQGVLSGLVILFIYQIGDLFNLNPLQMGILRVGILGAFMQMGYMMVLNILFYFDFQKDACILTFLYFACNALFTWVTLQIGLPAYGFGYMAAAFVTLLFGFVTLDRKLKEIDYWTFMRQPVLVPKFKFETERP